MSNEWLAFILISILPLTLILCGVFGKNTNNYDRDGLL